MCLMCQFTPPVLGLHDGASDPTKAELPEFEGQGDNLTDYHGTE